jgi:hypothetical protein
VSGASVGVMDWLPVLTVIVTLVLLVVLERWVHQHIHGVAFLLTRNKEAAVLLYAVPLFPGVLLHEFSHWAMAKLLLVKTCGMSLLPKRDRSGHIRLGSVTIERADPVRSSLIGIAPLISGSLVALYLGYRMFGVGSLGGALERGDIGAILTALVAVLRVPDMWLWLYLLFAVANAMLPSPSDREMWPSVIWFLVIVVGLAYVLGLSHFLLDLAPLVMLGLRWLAVAFTVTLVADVPFVILIAIAEWLVGSIGGEQVYYYQPPKRKRK